MTFITSTCRSIGEMELVVGTYDEVLLGFRIVTAGEEFQIETSFIDHPHAGCIKTVAVSNKGILASGSTDESIRLLNLKKRRELGSLIHHSGTITSLEFHKGFLFSTSEDGKLCLWKTFTWECLRTFKGHKSAVNSVSVHPSGKLALTVGADKSLHTWNLITGRSAYITNIKQVADIVKWTPDGEKYLIVTNNKIDIYSVENAAVTSSIQQSGRISCLDFYNDSVCLYGGDGGYVYMHDIENNKVKHTLDTQTVRIKGLCVCPSPQEEGSCKKWLCICSSDGHIKVYKILETEDGFTTDLLAEHTTSFRLTCLAVYVKDNASHNTAEESETVETGNSEKIHENGNSKRTSEVGNSETTNKIQKKKNRKRKSSDVEGKSEVGNSEKTSKIQKKKNRKRKSSGIDEKADVVERRREVDTEIPTPKKLKKTDKKHLEFKQRKRTKKDGKEKLKRKEERIGDGTTTSPKKKNKKKKKMKFPV